jgi:hypothetical protein
LLRGVAAPLDQQLLVEGALIELRLLTLGFSLAEIKEFSKSQIELYLAVQMATEEKQAQDQASADRTARMKNGGR